MKVTIKSAIFILFIGMLIGFIIFLKSERHQPQIDNDQVDYTEVVVVTTSTPDSENHVDTNLNQPQMTLKNNTITRQDDGSKAKSTQSSLCVDFELENEIDPMLQSDFAQFAADIGINLSGAYNEYAYYDELALQTMAQGGDKRAMYALGLYYAWYPDYHSRMLNQFSQAQIQLLEADLTPVERLNLAEHWLNKAGHEGFIQAFAELEFVIRDRQIYQMNTPQDQALKSVSKEQPVLPPYTDFVKWIAPEYDALGLGILNAYSQPKELSPEQKTLLQKMKDDWIRQRQLMSRDIQLKLQPPDNVKQMLQRLKINGECQSS